MLVIVCWTWCIVKDLSDYIYGGAVYYCLQYLYIIYVCGFKKIESLFLKTDYKL